MFLGRFGAGRLLDSGRLLQTAKSRALLEDFGAGDFRPRFDASVRSLNATLSGPAERAQRQALFDTAEAELVTLLVNRLQLRDWQKKNPQRCAAPLKCETLVVGRPSSMVQQRAEQLALGSAARTPLAEEMDRLVSGADPVELPARHGAPATSVPLERLAACDFPAALWRLEGNVGSPSRFDHDVWKWPLLALRSLRSEDQPGPWILWSTLATTTVADLVARLGDPEVISIEISGGVAEGSVGGPARGNHTGVGLAGSKRLRRNG